jgi:hypothetical protein
MDRMSRLAMLIVLVGVGGLSVGLPLTPVGPDGLEGSARAWAGAAGVGSAEAPLFDRHSCAAGSGGWEAGPAPAAATRASTGTSCLPCRILRELVSLLYRDLLKPLLTLFLGFGP